MVIKFNYLSFYCNSPWILISFIALIIYGLILSRHSSTDSGSSLSPLLSYSMSLLLKAMSILIGYYFIWIRIVFSFWPKKIHYIFSYVFFSYIFFTWFIALVISLLMKKKKFIVIIEYVLATYTKFDYNVKIKFFH